MARLFTLRKILALTLVLTVLTARFGSLTYETFVQPIQSHISKIAFFADGGGESKTPQVKPKRFSLDLLNWVSSKDLLPPFIPQGLPLHPYLPFLALPEVYLEKFFPPDPVSS